MHTELLQQAFLHPGDEYSPMPFWFWNDELTEAELTRQIDDFHAHGVAGFVIHPRKGLPGSIPYMSDSFLHFVRHAVDEAARRGMRVVLYDEAMYPSGAAHGMVAAENPEWASRCLWMETHDTPVPDCTDIVAVCAAQVSEGRVSHITLQPAKSGMYALPQDGRVLLVFREGFSGGTIRGIHENEDDGEALAPRSADLLNPDAVQAFIRLTHERYYAALPEHFGRTVIAMFTDEPDIVGRNARRGAIAWTHGFLQEFGSAADLPLLFLAGDGDDTVRRRYRRAVNNRMLRTYYQPLADWCESHGIALTGHPAKGWDIGLLAPFQLPGQDTVWRYVEPGKGVTGDESVLGKCGADAARHRNRPRNANECFGCCGPAVSQWAMTPGDMKWYMDYLFVRGVNLLYPHAFYYSVRDGRGDERPPDVGPNNTWWPEYTAFAAYMRRMSWLMTGSVNQARVAVLCEEDRMPWQPCIPLYEGQIEFNYLETSLLPQCRIEGSSLCIAQQRYTHVITGDVPLDDNACAVLDAFAAAGGQVLTLPEGLPTDASVSPAAPGLRITHVVKGSLHFYLLVNEGDMPIETTLTVPVTGHSQWWDAWTGAMEDAEGYGSFPLALGIRESRILCIDPKENPVHAQQKAELSLLPLPAAVWHVVREDGVSSTIAPQGDGKLPGWETLPGWKTYSGWVCYEAEVSIPAGTLLDLGEVHEMARVYADGQHVGTRLWGPYRFPLPQGATQLRIEVANTPAGKMDGVTLPSGLMG